MNIRKPDDLLHFRSLPIVVEAIQENGSRFRKRSKDGVPPEEALFDTYFEMFPEQWDHFVWYAHFKQWRTELDIEANPMFLHQTLEARLGHAEQMIRQTIAVFFPHLARSMSFHDHVKMLMDPIEMFRKAGRSFSNVSKSDRLERRLIEDARIMLGTTFQLSGIEFVDPQQEVRDSLLEIEQIERDTLFQYGGLRDFAIVSILNPDDCYRVRGVCDDAGEVMLFPDYASAKRRADSLKQDGFHVRVELEWPCRAICAGEKTYHLFHDPRDKEAGSVLRKLESGGGLQDRRGFKYTLIAVEDSSGLRVARRPDAKRLLEITLDRLWSRSEFEVEWYSGQPEKERVHNNLSHRTYWDQKVKGRFKRRANGDVISGGTELIIQPIADFLSAEYSTGSDNHRLRRELQLVRNICPKRWPHIPWEELYPHAFSRPSSC